MLLKLIAHSGAAERCHLVTTNRFYFSCWLVCVNQHLATYSSSCDTLGGYRPESLPSIARRDMDSGI